MKTVSMTEFNQRPSRVARLAADADVIVLRRGKPVLKITHVGQDEPDDPLDALIRSGLVRPPRSGSREQPLPSIRTDVDLDAALAGQRGRLDD